MVLEGHEVDSVKSLRLVGIDNWTFYLLPLVGIRMKVLES
jgi:hypothetical protein